MALNLKEIEERLRHLPVDQGTDLVFELLLAYGIPKASVSRLRNGSYNKADDPQETLWKGKVFFRHVPDGDESLYTTIDNAKDDPRILKERPRFLIVANDEQLLARDMEVEGTLDISLTDIPDHAAFFLPWIGIEKTNVESISLADVKAAEKMAKLYDEIIRDNEISLEADVHDLNVFFSRLLFCFFAEDTGVFDEGAFTNTIASSTQPTGDDVNQFLDDLFDVLDTKQGSRKRVPSHFRGFGYVNGNLFGARLKAPRFNRRARSVVLECGELDWSQINPDIFGSMIQAVVHPSQREGLGMHYTSVENILKVIRPLFLDELEAAFDAAADSAPQLNRLLDRLSKIQVFDPACGSGNFLVISYKELRRLEHRILVRIAELDPAQQGLGLFKLSGISLENFYGIEIDDFAREIASLSLWLAKHQMNKKFQELFGAEIPLIPLKEGGNIVCGNAARIDWGALVPDRNPKDTYLLGNPPYQGGTRQSESQKEDLRLAFDDPTVNKYLDYVSIWLYKGGNFVADRGARLGFVTTNSVSQGNHVALLWPRLFGLGVEVTFAHAAFRWTNAARGNAGVICVIIGLARRGELKRKTFYAHGTRREVSQINAYLVPDGSEVIVQQRGAPSAGLPPMVYGSMPRDGGHLVLELNEAEDLIRESPDAKEFIRRYGGARETLSGNWRACLWIPDERAAEAASIPRIAERLERVRAFRLASKASSTRAYAGQPHRFVQRAHKETPSIIVPRVSSERRDYIPMDFLDSGTVISDLGNALYDAEPWIFGLIQSRMHMVWVRAVAGRMKTDYRYSAVLVYNTFPVPPLSGEDKAELTEHAFAVLGAREQFSNKTLSELYERDKMPGRLLTAHTELDEMVDRLYRERAFESDEDRLAILFELYAVESRPDELVLHA